LNVIDYYIKEYHCTECDSVIERDIKNSMNLIYEGIKILIKSNKILELLN